jgi:hypothetical protein
MKRMLILLLLIPLAAACGPTKLEWKEEILLHDGRKIIAERTELGGGRAEPGQSGAPKKRTISFPDPKNPKQRYTHSVTGNSNYLLVDFDETGSPWMIVYVGVFSDDTDCPNGTYQTFKWIGSGWQSVIYGTLPKLFKEPNLPVGYIVDAAPHGKPTGDLRTQKGLLSAETIKYILESFRRNHASSTVWKLAQIKENGRPIDCQAYPPVRK